jgi:hypothetical protein
MMKNSTKRSRRRNRAINDIVTDWLLKAQLLIVQAGLVAIHVAPTCIAVDFADSFVGSAGRRALKIRYHVKSKATTYRNVCNTGAIIHDNTDYHEAFI